MNFDQLYQEYLQLDDPDCTVSLYDRLKWFYDKAHRHGWEQAKREAWYAAAEEAAARDAAWEAARDVAKPKPEAKLRRICGEIEG